MRIGCKKLVAEADNKISQLEKLKIQQKQSDEEIEIPLKV